MRYKLFDYLNGHGRNDFKLWSENLQPKERAKLNSKLDMLEKEGSNLFPEILTGTNTSGILKLRVKGGVQLRPMLCRGPVEVDKEFTLLLGAFEVGGELVPTGADSIADKLKNEIKREPDRRRIKHERVG